MSRGRDLEVRGLTAGWGGPPVLHRLDLDVPAGTTVAVLGESGSGKSTLLRVVAGLLAATSGTILLGGKDVTVLPPEQRRVGMVFQSLALFPQLDVLANVAFGPHTTGTDRAESLRIAREWLDRVGLSELAGRDVASLSGGQRQRVALARSLAAAPDALLLDEPLGALDTGLRATLLGELRKVFAQTGTTVVHVTHDPSEAATIADRLAVLEHGRVSQVGTTASLWLQPASATVARLVGHPNVVEDAHTARIIPPDAISLALDGPTDATVDLVTPDSGRVTVRCDDGTRLVAAIAPSSAPTPGARVRASIDPTRVMDVARTSTGPPNGVA